MEQRKKSGYGEEYIEFSDGEILYYCGTWASGVLSDSNGYWEYHMGNGDIEIYNGGLSDYKRGGYGEYILIRNEVFTYDLDGNKYEKGTKITTQCNWKDDTPIGEGTITLSWENDGLQVPKQYSVAFSDGEPYIK